MRRRLLLIPAIFAAFAALAPAPAHADQKFIVFFHEWSAELDPAARDVIAAAVAYAQQNAAMRVEVTGFASNSGGQKSNLYLSMVRAQRINDIMEESGVSPDRMSRVGEGSVNAVGTSEESRRVEIVVRTP